MSINYQKVGWDTTKYFNPTNMNQMDNGIKAACDKADANEAAIADVNSKLGNTDISAIGDGTVTGGLNALNSTLNGLTDVSYSVFEASSNDYGQLIFYPNSFGWDSSPTALYIVFVNEKKINPYFENQGGNLFYNRENVDNNTKYSGIIIRMDKHI